MTDKTDTVSFRVFDETKNKMEQARQKMSKSLNYDKEITWDAFFDVLMNMYLPSINNSLENCFDRMKEESSKTDLLRGEIKEYFKQQNNQYEELLGVVVKQNDNTEILQKLKSIETQNESVSLTLKSVQEFNSSMNDNLRGLIDSVKTLLSNIGDMTLTLSDKITQKLKHHFGISVPMILYHITKNNSLSIEKKSDEEATKDINAVVSIYQNFYNSSDSYSGSEIDEIIDRYTMKKKLK